VASFYTNLHWVTIGGTKTEAAVVHSDIAKRWRERVDFTDFYCDDEPGDANKDVEGFGEWTSSFEISFEASDEAEARALIDSLIEREQAWNLSAEIISFHAEEE
jgi:hypothetical protein